MAALGPASVAAGNEPPASEIVDLDKLLKLPDTLEVEPEVRVGATRAEWRARFQGAREDLAAARAALANTRAKLENVAGESSAWKMGAPGLGGLDTGVGNNSPLDYALSTEMRHNREEVERSERVLAELSIEANLAGVPEAWWEDPVDAEAQDADQVPE